MRLFEQTPIYMSARASREAVLSEITHTAIGEIIASDSVAYFRGAQAAHGLIKYDESDYNNTAFALGSADAYRNAYEAGDFAMSQARTEVNHV